MEESIDRNPVIDIGKPGRIDDMYENMTTYQRTSLAGVLFHYIGNNLQKLTQSNLFEKPRET